MCHRQGEPNRHRCIDRVAARLKDFESYVRSQRLGGHYHSVPCGDGFEPQRRDCEC